jgi:4-amino-4-deoxy-L-arabinose transferase-like glycosyltransferase
LQWAGHSFAPEETVLLLTARDAVMSGPFFSSLLGGAASANLSALWTILTGMLFALFSPSVWLARIPVMIAAISTLILFARLGSRLFHPPVGLTATGFMLATWGFFSGSTLISGAMAYVLVVISLFLLFFDWFDSTFRSRTYARSLYLHFIGMGTLLGIAFLLYGLAGILFPTMGMLTTVLLCRRGEFLIDIHYRWLTIPLGLLMLIGLVAGSIWGGLSFWVELVHIQPTLKHLGDPLIGLLPVMPLLLPALTDKDLWGRALLLYNRAVCLLIAWFLWGLLFLILHGPMHQVWSLLVMLPLLIVLGVYLTEVFRNPVIPKALRLVLDGMTLLGLILGVAVLVLTFQILPPELKMAGFMLALLLPLVSIIMGVVRDASTSRFLVLAIVPCGILLCILTQFAVKPLFYPQPGWTLARQISAESTPKQPAEVLAWYSLTPGAQLGLPHQPVVAITRQLQLESRIQTREGILYLMLPETTYYQLPPEVRAMTYMLAQTWQWKAPLQADVLWQALLNETLDFDTLSGPVLWVKIP